MKLGRGPLPLEPWLFRTYALAFFSKEFSIDDAGNQACRAEVDPYVRKKYCGFRSYALGRGRWHTERMQIHEVAPDLQVVLGSSPHVKPPPLGSSPQVKPPRLRSSCGMMPECILQVVACGRTFGTVDDAGMSIGSRPIS